MFKIKCYTCHGEGYFDIDVTNKLITTRYRCHDCHGKGKIELFKIPTDLVKEVIKSNDWISYYGLYTYQSGELAKLVMIENTLHGDILYFDSTIYINGSSFMAANYIGLENINNLNWYIRLDELSKSLIEYYVNGEVCEYEN